MSLDVLIKPLVTEKTNKIGEKYEGKYTFVVHKKANKLQIKNAIEQLYSVTVVDVNTSITASKPKSRFSKTAGMLRGRTQSIKKAYITLSRGETIDFYEGI